MSNDINVYRFTNGSPVYSGKITKHKGIALEKPRSFFIRPLTIKDCSAMEDLSVCIYDNLKDGQECFIHKHDRKYYRDLFENNESDNVKYVGAFIGDRLIAMSYFRLIDNNDDLQSELPDNRLNMFSNNDRGIGRLVAALGADSVHPNYRGNRLNTIMIDYRTSFAKDLGATDFVSIIDRKNVWNMTPYFENGFNMFSSAVDPADNGQIALMHKPANEGVVHNDNDYESMDYTRLNVIDNMFRMKRIGIAYDKKTSSIIFAKTNYYADLRRQPSRQNIQSVAVMMREKNASRY